MQCLVKLKTYIYLYFYLNKITFFFEVKIIDEIGAIAIIHTWQNTYKSITNNL